MPPISYPSSTRIQDFFGTIDCHLDRHQHRPFLQKLVENLVSCIPYVAAYLDDVIVTGRTKGKHLQNLKQILSALNEYGMKLRLDKCEFFRQQVTYMV